MERETTVTSKKVLLKAIVQAIPTFAMTCIKLPISLCHDIEMMICKFWWEQRGDRREIHWKKLGTLCKAKAVGWLGLGTYGSSMMPYSQNKFGGW